MGATTAELISAINSPCVDVMVDDVSKAIADARAFDKKVRAYFLCSQQNASIAVSHVRKANLKESPMARVSQPKTIYTLLILGCCTVLQVGEKMAMMMHEYQANASARALHPTNEFYPFDH